MQIRQGHNVSLLDIECILRWCGRSLSHTSSNIRTNTRWFHKGEEWMVCIAWARCRRFAGCCKWSRHRWRRRIQTGICRIGYWLSKFGFVRKESGGRLHWRLSSYRCKCMSRLMYWRLNWSGNGCRRFGWLWVPEDTGKFHWGTSIGWFHKGLLACTIVWLDYSFGLPGTAHKPRWYDSNWGCSHRVLMLCRVPHCFCIYSSVFMDRLVCWQVACSFYSFRNKREEPRHKEWAAAQIRFFSSDYLL